MAIYVLLPSQAIDAVDWYWWHWWMLWWIWSGGGELWLVPKCLGPKCTESEVSIYHTWRISDFRDECKHLCIIFKSCIISFRIKLLVENAAASCSWQRISTGMEIERESIWLDKVLFIINMVVRLGQPVSRNTTQRFYG